MKLFRKPLLAAGLIALAGIGFLGTGDAFAMNTTDNQPKKAVKIVQTAGRQQLGNFAPDFAKSFLHYGWEKDTERLFAQIDSVTAADIQQVAQTVFDPTQLTTLIYK